MKSTHPLTKSNWIWPILFKHPLNCYVQFRHDFTISVIPEKAPLYISADQSYVLYINGKYVGRGPARGFQERWPYDEYNVTDFLKKEKNRICVIAYNAGSSSFQYRFDGRAGFICAAEWGKTKLYSGKHWLARLAPQYNTPQTEKLSYQLNYQEWADTQGTDNSWISSSRIPKEDGWKNVEHAWPFGVMPWHNMEPRNIPNLTGNIVPYQKTQYAAIGRCSKDWNRKKNMFHPWHNEQKKLTWTPTAKGKKTSTGLRFNLTKAGRGMLSAISCDLGRPQIGTLIIEAETEAAGETIDFFFTEGQFINGRPIVGDNIKDGCEASMVSRITLPKGKTRYEFFQMIGHRMVVAIARETKKDIKLKLSMRNSVYPFDIKGSFESGDKTINDIYRISCQTQQVCALDTYVDTPWREQAQWWGDARVQAMNSFFISGDSRLVKRGIRSIAQQKLPNGLTFGHAPTIAYNCILPDFSLIWIITIWDYFHQTGKTSLFTEQLARIHQVLGYFEGEGLGEIGLLKYDSRYWLFLDWTDIFKEGFPAVYNLWYLFTLQKLSKLAEATNDKQNKDIFDKIRARHEKRIIKFLWNPKKQMFRDGITYEGKGVNRYSIHTQTLAIMCGLKPQSHNNMITKRLLPYLKGKKLDSGLPSSYWVTYIYDVMETRGYAAEVLKHIRNKWQSMIPWEGCWESFASDYKQQNGDFVFGSTSMTHAWAAHPIYHLTRIVAGIIQDDTAWTKINFAPLLDKNIGHTSATIPTPNGKIETSWRYINGKGFKIKLKLPKRIQATVSLPNINNQVVTGMNCWNITNTTTN